MFIKSFKGQNWLLPPSIEGLIPEDHICFLVESLVEALDFSEFVVRYSKPGHPAYHPRVLLKLLVMGVMDSLRSSRKIARNARENIVYMYLAEKLTPDFRTVSDFRKNNPILVKEAFKHTVTLAKQNGMIDLSLFSTDGTKIKANAANKRGITKDELEFLLKFVDKELEEWAKQDELEDEAFGNLRGHDQLPNISKKKVQRSVRYYVKKTKEKGHIFKEELKEKLQKAKEEIEENNLEKVSLTDKESRFMKNKKGRLELSYNPQITVDKNGFILANDICQDMNDKKQLQPQVLQTEKNLGSLPEDLRWCFDDGFHSGENISFLLSKNIDGYIPHTETKTDNPYAMKNFIYDAEKDEFTCPANQPVTLSCEHVDKKTKRLLKIYLGRACRNCPNQNECTKSKGGIRRLTISPYMDERNAMKTKMETPEAKETYKMRAQTVEPVIGDIKENKGVRTFLTRGLENAKTEFNLVCTANNIRRMWTSIQEKDKGISEIQLKSINDMWDKILIPAS